jgi:hypothetical protein
VVPDPAAAHPRIKAYRNHSCFLLGVSWSHHHEWPTRLTHVYLGPVVVTVRTGGWFT